MTRSTVYARRVSVVVQDNHVADLTDARTDWSEVVVECVRQLLLRLCDVS